MSKQMTVRYECAAGGEVVRHAEEGATIERVMQLLADVRVIALTVTFLAPEEYRAAYRAGMKGGKR